MPGNSARAKELSDPTEIPPLIARHLLHDPCRTVISVVLQTIAAIPPLLFIKMAYRNPKTGLGGRVSEKKLASEAFRAIGGIAWNSIANPAIVGH